RVSDNAGDRSYRSHRGDVHNNPFPLFGHDIGKYARGKHRPQQVEVDHFPEIINFEIEKILFRWNGGAGHVSTRSIDQNVDRVKGVEQFFLRAGKLLRAENIGRNTDCPESFYFEFFDERVTGFLATTEYRDVCARFAKATRHFGAEHAGTSRNERNLAFYVN